jgi:2-succinyl-6-hydroxy-2,4-cyclohexadiene-1-carboxylate synthase
MRIEAAGITLNVDERGEGRPLLALHGFTGGASTWRALAEALPDVRVVAVDLIGQGESDAPGDERRYAMEHAATDIVAVLDALEIERAALLGYSMGGRVALQAALAAPERFEALLLESASPGIADAGERAARVAADRALAERIERDGVAAFVDEWEAIPLFATQRALAADVRARLREQRLRNSARGLANSLRGMGAGAQAALHARLRELPMPVQLIAGALDTKYVAIAHEMATSIGRARVRVVEGAGHAVHLEQPEAFARAVREVTDEVAAAAGARASA